MNLRDFGWINEISNENDCDTKMLNKYQKLTKLKKKMYRDREVLNTRDLVGDSPVISQGMLTLSRTTLFPQKKSNFLALLNLLLYNMRGNLCSKETYLPDQLFWTGTHMLMTRSFSLNATEKKFTQQSLQTSHSHIFIQAGIYIYLNIEELCIPFFVCFPNSIFGTKGFWHTGTTFSTL